MPLARSSLPHRNPSFASRSGRASSITSNGTILTRLTLFSSWFVRATTGEVTHSCNQTDQSPTRPSVSLHVRSHPIRCQHLSSQGEQLRRTRQKLETTWPSNWPKRNYIARRSVSWVARDSGVACFCAKRNHLFAEHLEEWWLRYLLFSSFSSIIEYNHLVCFPPSAQYELKDRWVSLIRYNQHTPKSN